MKKKIALLLAAVMVVGSLPMTAFASTDNNVSKIPTVEVDDNFTTTIVIDEFDGVVPGEEAQTVKLTLTGAEWASSMTFDKADANGVTFTKIGDKQAFAEFDITGKTQVMLTLVCTAKEDGEATVTIDPTDAVVSAETLKIANVAGGATTTTISGTTSIKETATKIKNIVIEETTAGSIDKDGTIKLKLTNGFKWCADSSTSVVVFPADCGITGATFRIDSSDAQVAYIDVVGESTGKEATLSLMNPYIKYSDSDVEIGDECEVTVSNAGTTKESIVVGSAADYDLTFKVADKELPVFYSGRYDDDQETLVVTIKEAIAGSWLNNRKAKLVFPEGVEVMAVNEDKATKNGTASYSIDENEVEINGVANGTGKFELNLKFELSVEADFTGDIDVTLTGSAVGEDQTVTVATAVFPVTVDADVNELKIDYRNTPATDIVITEVEPGVLAKDKTVSMYIDGIQFDGDPTVEVESGDIKIKDVKTNGGLLQFTVKTESQKEAGVIRISDVELYMQRSLPAGEYDLVITTIDEVTVGGQATIASQLANSKDAIIQNYSDDDDETGVFGTDEVTVLDGYVTVVTAGREQDDSTFTTKVTVTIGATTMMAGTKEIALDVPAYIANGYTMLPVRAVTEALSGSAIVRWDDATKTVTITFGQRVINMTVGSRTMVINGVNVAMQAACEITDSRAFIPLRDLGYALGLNDSKIAWDDATKTATLN